MIQKKTRVRLWLYEDTRMFMEGIIIGFDEYMNVVLDDAVEMDTKKNSRLPVGRCLLKGDSITLIQYVYICCNAYIFLCGTDACAWFVSLERALSRALSTWTKSHLFLPTTFYFAFCTQSGKHSPCGQPTRKTRDNRNDTRRNVL
jgi:small nuclear ribonucleoprotein E